MQNISLNILETILVVLVASWIIGLGFSLIVQRHRQYFTWTGETIQYVFSRGWQLILGLIIGYWLSGNTFLVFL